MKLATKSYSRRKPGHMEVEIKNAFLFWPKRLPLKEDETIWEWRWLERATWQRTHILRFKLPKDSLRHTDDCWLMPPDIMKGE